MKINSDGRPLSYQKIKLIAVKLLTTNESRRAIAKHCHVSATTVGRLKSRLSLLGIRDVKEITSLNPDELYKKIYPLFNRPISRKASLDRFIPDFKKLAESCIEKKIPQKTIYNDYCKEAVFNGLEPLSISYFCSRIKDEIDKIRAIEPDYYFAQDFQYGMYVQVDFSGDRYKVLTYNGEIDCCLMVLCWPASYYVYAEFVTSQTTAESCRVIGNAIKTFGNRVPSIVMVDNAKCFVTKHSGAEAIINKNFESFLQEMGVCVEAAPPYHPQKKSAVEYSVRLCQRLLAPIKHQFNTNVSTLVEHNKFLRQKIDEVINKGAFRGSSEKTRDYLFKNYDIPACLVTNKIPTYQADITSVIVPRSYLLTIKGHEYSVPYLYIKKKVDVIVGNDVIIIKYEGKEIARHQRTDGLGRTILEEHMPEEHQSIEKNNKIYKTTDDVLRISKELDEGLYRFCLNRIKRDKTSGTQKSGNTIRCCRAVINFYKSCPFKDLFSEACISVLSLPPDLWNSYKVKELYEQVIREYYATDKVQHQTEIFRPLDDDAHIRNNDDDLSEDIPF